MLHNRKYFPTSSKNQNLRQFSQAGCNTWPVGQQSSTAQDTGALVGVMRYKENKSDTLTGKRTSCKLVTDLYRYANTCMI